MGRRAGLLVVVFLVAVVTAGLYVTAVIIPRVFDRAHTWGG